MTDTAWVTFLRARLHEARAEVGEEDGQRLRQLRAYRDVVALYERGGDPEEPGISKREAHQRALRIIDLQHLTARFRNHPDCRPEWLSG